MNKGSLPMSDQFQFSLNKSDQITKAAEVLQGTVRTPQERLIRGGTLFWVATIFSGDWSSRLAAKINHICRILFAGGTVRRTVSGMDAETASKCATQLGNEMNSVAAQIQQAENPR
jgi:hypothetical protein